MRIIYLSRIMFDLEIGLFIEEALTFLNFKIFVSFYGNKIDTLIEKQVNKQRLNFFENEQINFL